MNDGIQIRLLQLMAEKMSREGKTCRIGDVARTTNIDRRRLYEWRDGTITMIRSKEVAALCHYFSVGVAELLLYQPYAVDE
jgi:DNA-binding Xre family transcriptional regulator